ncbi:unnamed protein product [Acanthoscelides obtectus]|uniref:Glycolipid transfer protein domain-containing protein n=1 Tax=Acanthoscelides obtectus TaxID=200917 RepID=A0A9P0NUK9_ACAOB|nr:unnamed protein product [Acanthoscelides obtectus]CAK1634006.1 Ceramide-1-phosphate transfer protein [Acanthoscelides obtectus]
MSQAKDYFNIKLVHENFEAAVHEDDDVLLQYYLDSFEELNKFFNLIGTVFGFVSKDLRAKMNLLQELMKDSRDPDSFKSVKGMIEYEKQNELLYKDGYTSGSRTLLRLHRGLEFIHLFLKKIGEIQNEDSTSGVCKDAYEQTLAKHHSFLIRNGAKIAIYSLPTKSSLLHRVSQGTTLIRFTKNKKRI